MRGWRPHPSVSQVPIKHQIQRLWPNSDVAAPIVSSASQCIRVTHHQWLQVFPRDHWSNKACVTFWPCSSYFGVRLAVHFWYIISVSRCSLGTRGPIKQNLCDSDPVLTVQLLPLLCRPPHRVAHHQWSQVFLYVGSTTRPDVDSIKVWVNDCRRRSASKSSEVTTDSEGTTCRCAGQVYNLLKAATH